MPRTAQTFQAQGLSVNGAGRDFDVDVAAAERDLTFAAANRGQKIDPHGIGNVFALARPFGAATEALITTPAAAESRKNVVAENGREVEVGVLSAGRRIKTTLPERIAATVRTAETGAETGRLAVAVNFVVVVFFPFFVIPQNVVSSRNFLKFFGCRRIVLVDVGMIFACQLMIGRLDFRLSCAFGHA